MLLSAKRNSIQTHRRVASAVLACVTGPLRIFRIKGWLKMEVPLCAFWVLDFEEVGRCLRLDLGIFAGTRDYYLRLSSACTICAPLRARPGPQLLIGVVHFRSACIAHLQDRFSRTRCLRCLCQIGHKSRELAGSLQSPDRSSRCSWCM